MTAFAKNNTGYPIFEGLASVNVIAERIDNLESGLSGETSLNANIEGGYIDGVPLGSNEPVEIAVASLLCSTIYINGIASTIKSFNTGATFGTVTCSGNGTFDGIVTCTSDIVCGGSLSVVGSIVTTSSMVIPSAISTNSKELLKIDIISFAINIAAGTTTITGTHGHTVYGRGCSFSYNGTSTDVYSVCWLSGTDYYVKLTATAPVVATGYLTVFYV